MNIYENDSIDWLTAEMIGPYQFVMPEGRAGTVCIKLSRFSFPHLTDHERLVNIETGIGSFGEAQRYRRLRPGTKLEITVKYEHW